MMMRLCSYVVVKDTGFAPNPFGGYCTLAACTPNRQGIRLDKGDWLVGHSGIAAGQRLVYAMMVSDVLDFDDYYSDSRFASKKPVLNRSWQEAAGDNMYHRGEDGAWIQDLSPFHQTEYVQRDTRNPRVFIAERFYYFGENAPPIPVEFTELIRRGQGCRCNYPADLSKSFVAWIERTYTPGVHGIPRDRDARCL
jgi:hypothetical protein